MRATRVCTVCVHEKREEIDKAILRFTPYREIAKQYGTSPSSLTRHNPHITKAVTKAAEKRADIRADNILAQLLELVADARKITESALAADKHAAAISGLRTVNDVLANVARLTGQLGDGGNTVNIALVAQGKAEEDELVRLRRLNPEERETLRALLQKMEGETVEAEFVALPVVTKSLQEPESR